MSDFRVPEKALRKLGYQAVEWPEGTGRVGYYSTAEVEMVARLARKAKSMPHHFICERGDYPDFDLDCPRCKVENEIALIHELKVELGACLVDYETEVAG